MAHVTARARLKTIKCMAPDSLRSLEHEYRFTEYEPEKTREPSTRIPDDRDHGDGGFEPPFKTDCDDSSGASPCSSGSHDILRGASDT